jgi:hypothetical protein
LKFEVLVNKQEQEQVRMTDKQARQSGSESWSMREGETGRQTDRRDRAGAGARTGAETRERDKLGR